MDDGFSWSGERQSVHAPRVFRVVCRPSSGRRFSSLSVRTAQRPETGEMDRPGQKQRIAVVGPCSSGKSTLTRRLLELGYEARHCTQEHSYVPDMWHRISRPTWLVYLDADFTTIARRRLPFGFGPEHLEEQLRRLAHAREHCDLYLRTDALTPEEVSQKVLEFLKEATSANQESETGHRGPPSSPDSSSSAASDGTAREVR